MQSPFLRIRLIKKGELGFRVSLKYIPTTKNSSKFVAVPSGGPASRGGAVKNGEDGGNDNRNALRGNIS